jgi:hypothetical protein
MDYKNILLILLRLPYTATDSDIENAVKALAGKVGNLGEIKAFSAAITSQGGGDRDADAEVARQMGNDPAKVKKFGGMTRVS